MKPEYVVRYHFDGSTVSELPDEYPVIIQKVTVHQNSNFGVAVNIKLKHIERLPEVTE